MQIKPRARRKVISVNTIHKIDSPLAICMNTSIRLVVMILFFLTAFSGIKLNCRQKFSFGLKSLTTLSFVTNSFL